MKDIAGFEGLYMIGRDGTCCGIKYDTCLKATYTSAGYDAYRLCKNGKMYNRYIHRLVAKAFIPNPDGKPCVHHKDGSRRNNHVDNLEWVTHSENVQRGYDNGRIVPDHIKERMRALGKSNWQKAVAASVASSKNKRELRRQEILKFKADRITQHEEKLFLLDDQEISDRDRLIYKLRFIDRNTLQYIGDKVNLTKERVRQILVALQCP